MSYAYKYKLLPGDRVIESIFLTGLSKHHAIYLGMDTYGAEWIAENHYKEGVRLVIASNFFHPRKKYTITRFKGSRLEREQAVKRALAMVGARYDLVNYNCEHYASYVQTGKSYSNQVNNAFRVVGITLLTIFLVKAFDD